MHFGCWRGLAVWFFCFVGAGAVLRIIGFCGRTQLPLH